MLSVLLALTLSLTAAAEPPLAIPGDAPPPRARPERLSPEKLRALQQYKDRRLSIYSETILHGGETTVWSTGWGGPRWGTAVHVSHAPVFTTRDWGFYQGPQRLSVPNALELAGDPRAVDLSARIARKQRAARGWYAVAGVGGAGVATGIVGQVLADDRSQWQTWSSVALGGAITAVVGMIGGAGPAGEARRLEDRPAASMRPDEAQDVVTRYNEQLAAELGLTPDEVWSVEAPVGR
ncbi:MAG: hypothetical protein H6742_14530 [Alphaproteobacteria bacterium]|nr:hypothetical protein [Alphaproteobacteria bacterium]